MPRSSGQVAGLSRPAARRVATARIPVVRTRPIPRVVPVAVPRAPAPKIIRIPAGPPRMAGPQVITPPPPTRMPPPPVPVPVEELRMDVERFELDMSDEIEARVAPIGAESFVHKRIIGAISGFVGGGPVGAVAGFVAPTSGAFTGANAGDGLGLTSGCPPGTRADSSGRCATTGVRGTIERILPGGRTGFQPASSGLLGMLSGGPEPPAEVGTITRNDGSVGPILRCPPGMVLAIDNQCYAKGLKGLANFRKWKPPAKPFLSGGDVKILRRADTLRRGKSTKKTLKALGLG